RYINLWHHLVNWRKIKPEREMSYFVRQSKYRHVFCEPNPPQNTFTSLRITTAAGEQQYIKANTKFFAVALQGGGGPVAVLAHDAY
ncbi:unnamed protein product, partial [Heterosigma akashiwo]